MYFRQIFLFTFISILSQNIVAQDTLKSANVQAILFVGNGKQQPLIVGLGGSEGGNAWASGYWKKTRDQFIEKGYAFLAIGYFGLKGIPAQLDRIAIEDIHLAILSASIHDKINKDKIAIIGGSRGADLAMLVASYFKDIDCVVGLVGSHAVFPGNTETLQTSSWTYEKKELPFIPVNEEAVPALMRGDLRAAFDTMLKDTIAENNALIKVESINGPLLLISATQDEICPSTPMAEKIIARLKQKNFPHYNQHIPIEGKHAESLKHFDRVFAFLAEHFPAK